MKTVLINFLGKSNSGPVFSLELAKGFADSNCNVYAILSDRVQNKKEWLKDDRIKCFFIDTYSSISELLVNSIKLKTEYKNKIKRYFNDVQIDIIIRTFYHPWAEEIDSCLHYKKRMTICHDPIPHSNEKWIKRYLYKKHILSSDEIIVLTNSFKKIVSDRYKFSEDQVLYVPHGLLSVGYTNQDFKIPINENSINFIFFGRIVPYKGLDITIDAFAELNKKYPNTSLYIIGSGDISKEMEKLSLINNVYIKNEYIPDSDIGMYFSIPNLVCVLSYIDATQSGVIPIAFEFKVPVIASNTGGLLEQLNNGKIGLLFENKNIEDLANKMEMFVNDFKLFEIEREKIAEYLPNLEWKSIAKKILEFNAKKR